MRLGIEGAEPSRLDRWIEEEAREQGLYYVDTRPAFRETDPRSFWIHPLDPHPNAVAHGIFADVLADFLTQHRLVGT